jgi:hypothetical protein
MSKTRISCVNLSLLLGYYYFISRDDIFLRLLDCGDERGSRNPSRFNDIFMVGCPSLALINVSANVHFRNQISLNEVKLMGVWDFKETRKRFLTKNRNFLLIDCCFRSEMMEINVVCHNVRKHTRFRYLFKKIFENVFFLMTGRFFWYFFYHDHNRHSEWINFSLKKKN